MNRTTMLQHLEKKNAFDIIIIGGGATGLGAAVDAATRGYKTLLVEQYDFAKGTSSRSTKLVHGGVRYLAQGNIKLVKEALRERGWLLQNAPHLTSTQPFVIPVYSWWEKWYYGIGLKVYDILSGKLSLGKTQVLSKKQTIAALPAIASAKLSGGVLYYDGQFDDSRMCIDLAATAVAAGASVVNYCKATSFVREGKKIAGVVLRDTCGDKMYTVHAKVVINATGVFTDAVMQLEDVTRHAMVSPSQGIHLVVDSSFFPGTNAMMIPRTDDGRVLFAVPWHHKVVLGTTDTPVDRTEIEPQPLEEEIAFILRHMNHYSNRRIERSDVKSVYVGLRPLVKVKGTQRTALLARDHTLVISPGGLVTITGGKWTTYRKMAEDAVDNAVFVAGLEPGSCVTRNLAIGDPIARKKHIAALLISNPSLQKPLHAGYPYTMAEVVYSVRHEMAVTVEDILARRTRLLFLDARAARASAPDVATLMAAELGKDQAWVTEQVQAFEHLAQQYLLH